MKPKTPLQALILSLCFVLVLLLVWFGAQWLENRDLQPETRGQLEAEAADAITVNGIRYTPKRNLTTILVMGIDRDSDKVSIGYRDGGQADYLNLLVIDAASKKVFSLPIDRDTMTSITILSVLGKKSGERVAQISLSHGFGDGNEQSCMLTMEAVSNLLLGVEMDDYIAMNLDGISALNDYVGGITVTLEDDFTSLDPAMKMGETLTLQGMQAEYFVRSRRSVGIGTNESRMKRQKLYINALYSKLKEIIQNDTSVYSLYDALLPYMQSSMNRGLMVNRIWAVRDYAFETLELAGEHSIGSDGFMEFHPDENALQQTVLQVFYQKTD